jgi:hypothetical protein
MKDKQFVYFPSLSSGNSKSWLGKNTALPNGTTSRFYGDDYPEEFRHKYFLLSAGHNLSYPNLRKDMGLEDSFVIGDSGGFQICTGAMKWKPEVKDKILNWLENNSDIAMNLDIPPRGKMFNFNEALDISVDNFKYFADNRQGKTKFLNVLQGDTLDGFDTWYKRVNQFSFNGWSIGVGRNTFGMIYAIALLIERGEFDKDFNEYLHLLGAASIKDFFIIGTIQKAFNKRFDNRVTITTDSSSPNRSTIFGTWYFDADYKGLKQQSLYFGKDGKTDYVLDKKPICTVNCPACKDITYEHFAGEWKEPQYVVMTNHNMAITTNAHRVMNEILDSHPETIKEIMGADFYALHRALTELVMSKEPTKAFHRYAPLLEKYCNKIDSNFHTKNPETFFEF